MRLKIKVKSEDAKWFFVDVLKALLLAFIAVTGIMCIACYNSPIIEQQLKEQQAELLSFALLFVGIIFILSTIIPASPVSHHNLICKHNKINKLKAEQKDV